MDKEKIKLEGKGVEVKEEDEIKKKRGRKRIKEKVTIKEQKKFFIDYSLENKKHELVIKLITEANNKEYGKEVTFKDLVDYSLKKVTA